MQVLEGFAEERIDVGSAVEAGSGRRRDAGETGSGDDDDIIR